MPDSFVTRAAELGEGQLALPCCKMILFSRFVCSVPFCLTLITHFFFFSLNQHLNDQFSNDNQNLCVLSLLRVPDCGTCWDKTLPNPCDQVQYHRMRRLRLNSLNNPSSAMLEFKTSTALQVRGQRASICQNRVALRKIQLARKCIQASELFYGEHTMMLCSFTKSGSQINESAVTLGRCRQPFRLRSDQYMDYMKLHID